MNYPGTASDALLAAIVGASDDAIISNTLDAIVTSWNQGAERIFGWTAAEAIGGPVSIIASPLRPDDMPTVLARMRRGERIDHYETIRQRKDGQPVYVSLTVSPIYNSDGIIVGASKIARDITERKLAEEAIIKHTERLVRANADLQQFAYITSHDLQEPLRTVLACTEMFLGKSGQKLDSDERELLDFVINAARRMSGMIGDLLTYSRTLDEELPLTTVATSEVVDWAVNNLYIAIQTANAEIKYEKSTLPAVRANKVALVQLFQNLLSNAIKYHSAEPPKIEISVERRNGQLIFSVADNGIGIAPAYHERIFGLFKRLHTTREYPGSGIGLSLCRRIVQMHGGTIWVESEVGKGSRFLFSLPPAGEPA